MKFVKTFYCNMRGILVYSDSELLELAICFILFFVNPTRVPQFAPSLWCLLGVAGAVSILFGLGWKSLRARETGLLLTLVNITAINFMAIRHGCVDASYILQNLIIGFVWWKVGKQRFVTGMRKGCRNGTK